MKDQMKQQLTFTQPVVEDPLHDLLTRAIQLAQRGDRQGAYQLSLQATRQAPKDVRAWMTRAEMAPSKEEMLFCLSQANALNPNYPLALDRMYRALRELLVENPALAYVDETEGVYRIRSSEFLNLAIPKYRQPQTQATQIDPAVQRAFKWLRWAIVGMLPVGLGTLVLAPLTANAALQARKKKLSQPDDVRTVVILALSGLLWLVSIPLSILFFLHVF